MKRILLPITSMIMFSSLSAPSLAAEYDIDAKHAHAFIQFKIKHLGYSWVLGRFNKFKGHFSYDEKNPDASKVEVTIDTSSVDTNEAERDKHLRSIDFLDVSKYPEAKFVSTSYKELAGGKARLTGNFTLRGITKPITIDVDQIGHGPDPWGGYRRGFEGRTTLTLKDFDIKYNLGPAAKELYLYFSIEGIRRK